MSDEIPRTLPHNLDAERAVLGAILIRNEAINAATVLIDSADFFRAAHRIVFDRMVALSQRGQAIDFVTLVEELGRTGQVEEVGGAAYVAALTDGVPRATNVEHYARIVKEKSTRRRLIVSANQILIDAYSSEDEADQQLDAAQRQIFEISDDAVRSGFVPLSAVVRDGFATLEALQSHGSAITGVPTGFTELDTVTSGLQPSDLVIVAARPSMGKTSFVLNIASHVGMRAGKGAVGFFSLEMSKEQLFMRLLTAEARIDAHRLRTGRINTADWGRITEALGVLTDARIFIDDTASIGVLEMRAKARQLKADQGLDLLIVDYVQLMQGRGRFENRQLEIASISRSLKALAKELHVPVVALSQLSRAPDTRSDHRPLLSDLRECVTGDTLVMLADGRRVPIAGLVGQTPEVLAVDGAHRVVAARSDRVWMVGERPVFRVLLASGRRLRATGRHRVLGSAGWTRVDALAPGERVALARELPEVSAIPAWSDARAALLDARVSAATTNPNVDTLPREVFTMVREEMRRGGVSQRAMAARRGMSCGGHAHSAFAPTRAAVADHAQHLDSEPLRQWAGSPLFWDEVVAVEPAGTDTVYDLTVPGPACWLADGIVSHNSGSLEQDADVVLFIYRPAVYKGEDEEDDGIAEIIVGKQRNGPIGTVKLAFINEYTRFENLERNPYPQQE